MLLPTVVDKVTVILKDKGASGEVQHGHTQSVTVGVAKFENTCVEEQQPDWQKYTSSMSAVPLPADVLYGSCIGRSNQFDDIRQTSFVDIEQDVQQEVKDLDLLGNRKPSSKNNFRKSLSLDKVTGIPSAKLPSHQFRPNGFQNSMKGNHLCSGSFKGTQSAASVGRDVDHIQAMETLFSPSRQQQKVASTRNVSVNTSCNSLGHNAPKNRAINAPPPNLSAVTPPTRKFGFGPVGSSMRPLLTQSSSGQGIRNLWRDQEKKDVQPQYSDPLVNAAPTIFHERVMEIGALESETVRWERNKKIKKKNKQDRDS